MSEANPPTLRTVRVLVRDERVFTFRAAEPIRKGEDVAFVDDQTVRVARNPGDVVVGRATEGSVPS